MTPRNLAALAAAALAAACSSVAPTRFHTLLPADTGARANAPAALPASPVWVLLPVLVPAQVSQPQLVVRLADDTLAALEQDRWIAPLADELRAALVQRLALALAGTAPRAGSALPWRVELEVLRFDSLVGRVARIEAEWLLRPAGGTAPALRCRGVFEQAVAAGVPALAAGHREAVARLGDALAASLASALRDAAPSCAPVRS